MEKETFNVAKETRSDKLKKKHRLKKTLNMTARNHVQFVIYFVLVKDILIKREKIPHRNRSQVQVSLKVTAQIHHLNITVMLDFF